MRDSVQLKAAYIKPERLMRKAKMLHVVRFSSLVAPDRFRPRVNKFLLLSLLKICFIRISTALCKPVTHAVEHRGG